MSRKSIRLPLAVALVEMACSQFLAPDNVEHIGAMSALSNATGNPLSYRIWGTATKLGDGRVLLAGGKDASLNYLTLVDVYDPTTGTFSPTGAMAGAHYRHAAALLSNGTVLVVGGFNGSYLKSAELFNPSTGAWTSVGNMYEARAGHVAVPLIDGRVLVAGGYNAAATALATFEIYDPTTTTWSKRGYMNQPHREPSAVRLSSGRVLLAGGWNPSLASTAEIFDPATNSWGYAGTPVTGRMAASMVDLGNGKVFVAGGYALASPCCGASLASAEVYDIETNQWTATAPMATSRANAGIVTVNGNVFVFEGESSYADVGGSVERYSPLAGIWSAAPPLRQGRTGATATLLGSGKTLVSGGATAELYDDSTGPCTPTTCAAQGRVCGAISDGCGGTLRCGTCPSGQSCSDANVCVGGCTHEVCSVGVALSSGCSSCAGTVCARDAYCCSTYWDSICVGEARSWCMTGTCP